MTTRLECIKCQQGACEHRRTHRRTVSDCISRQEAIDRLSEVLSSKEEFEIAKQIIIEAPTVDEKEIIRKAFERVLEQLNGLMPIRFNSFGKTLITVEDVIKILKEECGINDR